MTTIAGATDSRAVPGRNEWGYIQIADGVVAKLAAQAAAEVPDAGAAATRLLGVSVPGSTLLGTRSTDLDGLPKVSASVDGSTVSLSVSMSVRWPVSVAQVSAAVRERITERLTEMTGLIVTEVRILVTDLVTTLPAPARVR